MNSTQGEDRGGAAPDGGRRDPGSDAAGPGAGAGEAAAPPDLMTRVLDLIRFLRANCAWDAAQTPRSLLPYLLEEAHEVADAVADGDDGELARELGDLLLNVGFQIVLAEERNAFGADDVVARLESKMRRRHPHLYGDGETPGWERMKAAERGDASVLAGLARGLDPLSRAHRIQERASGVGFDWDDAAGAFEKAAEELEEVRQALEEVAAAGGGAAADRLEAELGDLLFAVVNLTRLAGTHAMHALRRANQKFADRFQALETLAGERDVVLGEATLAELDALWDEVKAAEKE